MKKIITIFCLLFLQQATAQQINTAKLDSLFDILASKNLMMGSVAISKDDKIVYKKSFGYRYIDSSKKISADENTKYRIGSITKLFTSVMIFQLVQEHKLSLDTKLATFFPQIKNADKITIADMMYHRSGIHSFTDDSLYLSYYTKPQQENFIIDLIAKSQSDFEADTRFAYSNSNFFLLGCIVEKLDKRNYTTSLRKRITEKLHLSNTFLGGKINEAKDESYSYTFENNNWTKLPETDMSVPGGAGAIVSTPTDLNIFLNALFDKKIISEENLTKDTTAKGIFGMDIYKLPFYGKFGWGHGGDIDGFHADLFKFVNDGITIAVCYNGVDYKTKDILIDILSCCFDRPFNLSDFNSPQSINVDTSILDQYVGTYSSKSFPLKIKIFIEKNQLFAQADGQSSFSLSAISEKEFIFKQARIDMIFDAEKNEFTLKQGGGNYLFQKEQ
ncbi:MAG: serine hydrolase [Arachidicoccus sp.]|nr:serine hydrolase [Arachidicoccus sp.]